jgi:UDP-2,3-diacylglucosamine pyrophosphatase LpxH
MKRVILSDIHIGSRHYRADALISFLKEEQYDQLILAGDIIDFIKVPTFTSSLIDILKSIDFSKEIIYIVGNHDISFSGLVENELFGIKFVKHYEFEEGGRKIRIEHGDQYDTPIFSKGHFIKVISVLQDFFERSYGLNLTTWWMNIVERKRKLRNIWDILSRNSSADILILGHFHRPELITWTNEDGETKTYVNCGDWVEHQTWVLIEDGKVELKKFSQ